MLTTVVCPSMNSVRTSIATYYNLGFCGIVSLYVQTTVSSSHCSIHILSCRHETDGVLALECLEVN